MTKVEQAMEVLQSLPLEQQEILAEEFLYTVSLHKETMLSAKQHNEVVERLKQPHNYASDEAVQQMFSK